MSKGKSPGDRLILMVAKHGKNATLRKLAHSRMSGAVLEQAKRETAGLVVFEPIYHNGRRARSQAARLTARGIWQAIRLTRGYDAALVVSALAATDIKATLSRLEAERNPLAVELAGYRHDAQAFRQQEAGRGALERKTWETIEKVQEILARPRRKLSTRHYERLDKFLESRGISRTVKVPTFEQPAFPQTPSADKIPTRQAPAPSAPSTRIPGTTTPLSQEEQNRREYYQMLAEQNRIVAEAQRPQRQSFVPKDCLPVEPNANRERILKLFHETPYSGDLLASGKIWYDNREMTPEVWERERFRTAS